MTLADILSEARASLAEARIGEPDGRLLVEYFSGTTRADSIARPDLPVDERTVAVIRAALARRLAGEPVHRIIGFREFYGLTLYLTPETLEPRPDTETLVDAALPRLRQLAARECGTQILDLGTGTGAIALALLAGIPQATALGADISAGALDAAARNALENGLSGRFFTIRSDWFEKISGSFHAIVSNPPYISTNELETLQREVRDHDPARALDGGPDGLDAYRKIAQGSKQHLAADGFVAVEIGHTQKRDVTALFKASGFRLVEARQDLGQRDRVLVFVRT